VAERQIKKNKWYNLSEKVADEDTEHQEQFVTLCRLTSIC